MTSFISAGHNLEGPKKDPGAQANGRSEGAETIKFRDRVLKAMAVRHPRITVISDKDSETLGQYLLRIRTGNGSVVLEFHLDASNDPAAAGTTVIVADNASQNSKNFAQELVDTTAETFGIRNRGVKPESYTYVKRLGLMREQGIVALLELGFITNGNDMAQLDNESKATILADKISDIIARYDNLIK